jgi:hypothetical protein
MWVLLHTATVYTDMRSANKKKLNYREQSPLLEATSRAAEQDLLYFTRHLKIRSILHYSQPVVTNLSQINPAHGYQSCSCHNRFDSIILARSRRSGFRIPTAESEFFPSPKHTHCPGPLVGGYRGSFPGVSSRDVKLTSVWSRA